MTQPIELNWTIHKVLQTHPKLLDTLVDIAPAFRRLRNPILRQAQARLVTVEHAARIGGVDPADMCARLNREIGAENDTPAAGSPMGDGAASQPDWMRNVTVATELDVRPVIASGGEPFREITQTAAAIQVGEAFRLIAPFEPVPLYDALGKQGFDHAMEAIDGSTWRILFRRDRPAGRSSSSTPTAPERSAPVTTELTIDISELVPPEPMMRVLGTLMDLPPGGRLTVHHVRRPMHLYPRLDELGYAHQTFELGPNQIDIVIDKPAESLA